MNIDNELKIRNKSINQCSKETGIPYGALYPIVKGKVNLENCKYSTLKKLAEYLGCNIDDFFDEFVNFSVWWEDEKTAEVSIDGNNVYIKRLVIHPVKQIFAREKITKFELGEILKSRCWNPNRDNIEKYLYHLGLTYYNPYKIVGKTHGVMVQDKIWFKFPGEKLSWNDVRAI